jgi:lipoate-protein ligase B
MLEKCALHDLTTEPYAVVWRMQQDIVRAMKEDPSEAEHLILVEHPRVVTVGRRGSPAAEFRLSAEEICARGFEVFHVERGGRTTYHGPGQLVGYPILRLARLGSDVHRYLRLLEELMIRVAARFGVAAERREKLTGVWAGERKLASIGIAVTRWITYHGFALNVATNLEDFSVIEPCGLAGVQMTRLADLVSPAPTMAEARRAVREEFAGLFGVRFVEAARQETIW